MSIDLSRVTGISDSRGVITEIRDSLGRVIWSSGPKVGSIVLRPSADISFMHVPYPANITEGYRLINEEVSDGDATYIHSGGGMVVSHFALGGDDLPTGAIVTSVTVYAVPWSGSNTSARQVINLRLDPLDANTDLGSVTLYADPTKNFDGSLLGAVDPINNYILSNNAIPPLSLAIESYSSSSSKDASKSTGITQVYIVLGYEA